MHVTHCNRCSYKSSSANISNTIKIQRGQQKQTNKPMFKCIKSLSMREWKCIPFYSLTIKSTMMMRKMCVYLMCWKLSKYQWTHTEPNWVDTVFSEMYIQMRILLMQKLMIHVVNGYCWKKEEKNHSLFIHCFCVRKQSKNYTKFDHSIGSFFFVGPIIG